MESTKEEKIIKLVQTLECNGLKSNPALDYCMPVILLSYRIKSLQVFTNEVSELREDMINSILQISSKLSLMEVYEETNISRLRYCLCVFADELVLQNAEFMSSLWMDNTLSQRFFNYTTGGDKFFDIIDTWLQNPKKNKDFIECAYIYLLLGYKGKYQMLPDCDEKISSLLDSLAYALVPVLQSDEGKTFKKGGISGKRNAFVSYFLNMFSKKMIPIFSIILLACIYAYSYIDLHIKIANTAGVISTALASKGKP